MKKHIAVFALLGGMLLWAVGASALTSDGVKKGRTITYDSVGMSFTLPKGGWEFEQYELDETDVADDVCYSRNGEYAYVYISSLEDPFTLEDFTQAELEELIAEIIDEDYSYLKAAKLGDGRLVINGQFKTDSTTYLSAMIFENGYGIFFDFHSDEENMETLANIARQILNSVQFL